MHRSSESIGAIAAALAKAQSELANPEKSLTATISIAGPRGGERTFRYAPLSSGLDIMRKSLGRHEIAAVQTTAIDSESGLVRMTTVLAHSSGEWISSEWPVCPVSETAAPHRMGAALTYARRYALFTLVGIAGEDDVDAPDLPVSIGTHLPEPHPVAASSPPVGEPRKVRRTPSPPILDADASALLQEQLLGGLAGITTIEDLDRWARHSLPTKNTLTQIDAHLVEEAFQSKLVAIEQR